MSFSKSFQEGPVTIGLSESAGIASLSAAASLSLGGGEAQGVLGFTTSNSVSLKATTLAQLFFELVESKSPPGVVVFEEAAKNELLALLAQS